MNPLIGPVLLIGGLSWAVAADAGSPVQLRDIGFGSRAVQVIAQSPATAAPQPTGAVAPAALSTVLPAPSASTTPAAAPAEVTPTTPVSPVPLTSESPAANASPVPSANPDRPHLHRPGTDVDADSITGSLASNVFVLKGNVLLRSDPKIDREIGAASESDEPLTVTADEIDVDKLALSYVAKGHVHFIQGDRSGRADVAILDEQKHTLDLVGNADVLEGDHRAAAAKMHYNTLDKQFLGSGNVRIYEPLPTPDPNAKSTPAPKHKRRFPI
jgi:lipopolysaccharide assembly outer membrane protein LptD (OstA)